GITYVSLLTTQGVIVAAMGLTPVSNTATMGNSSDGTGKLFVSMPTESLTLTGNAEYFGSGINVLIPG
ncbi:hypothetical protein, partial [Escherichia coli]|uniref:hypothetical protein n=1 Tax=Escherichia coli TaxID=562 RepID=UPI0020276789